MSHESRIVSSAYADTINDQQAQVRKKHQNILQEIKAKDTEDANHLHTNPDKVKRAPEMAQAQNNLAAQHRQANKKSSKSKKQAGG